MQGTWLCFLARKPAIAESKRRPAVHAKKVSTYMCRHGFTPKRERRTFRIELFGNICGLDAIVQVCEELCRAVFYARRSGDGSLVIRRTLHLWWTAPHVCSQLFAHSIRTNTCTHCERPTRFSPILVQSNTLKCTAFRKLKQGCPCSNTSMHYTFCAPTHCAY